jgi:hypothetical protein
MNAEERRLSSFEIYQMCLTIAREALLRNMDEGEKEMKKAKEAEG